jgi:hypothetical protein
MAEEIKVLHEVYGESLNYNEFILDGKTIIWDVPEEAETVISAKKLYDKLLVVRSDFKENKNYVEIKINGKKVKVPPSSVPVVIKGGKNEK